MTCIQQPSLFKCHCFVIPKLANWTVSSSHLCLKVSIFRLFWLQMLILLVNSPVFSSHFPLQAYISCDSNVHFNSKCISIEHLPSNIIFTLPLHWPRKKGSTVAWSPWWHWDDGCRRCDKVILVKGQGCNFISGVSNTP